MLSAPVTRSVSPSVTRLSRLRAVVLLSGSVRSRWWSGTMGRSVLDLPVQPGQSVLSHWLDHALGLTAEAGIPRLAISVLVDRSCPLPESVDGSAVARGGEAIRLEVERDPSDYRGTGGLLRDISVSCDEGDYLLVATGAQLLTEPLEDVARELAAASPDVAIVAHDDGTPSGLMWVRCGCLNAIPAIGFVDMKEQALPQIARRHQVKVVKCRPPGLPIRTPAEYLAAVRTLHVRQRDDGRLGDPYADEGRPAFALVEDGAEVHPTARVHDSVVLRGGTVGRHATVVRSLVGPDGIVRGSGRVFDEFVTAPGSAAPTVAGHGGPWV